MDISSEESARGASHATNARARAASHLVSLVREPQSRGGGEELIRDEAACELRTREARGRQRILGTRRRRATGDAGRAWQVVSREETHPDTSCDLCRSLVVEGDGRRERVHGERVEARGAARKCDGVSLGGPEKPKSESGPEKCPRHSQAVERHARARSMGLDPHVQGSSRSETRGLIAAIIDSFNETGNPPVALVQRAMAAAGIPWQNQHIRWKDDGTCVTAAPSLSAREPTPGTRANAPESIEHAHPPRPASPTPQDQRKRPREDVPALGDLPAAAPATKRKTNGPSDAVESQKKPLVVVSEEWSPDSDPRLGRIFRLRVDRDGNPRGDGVFADDAYPLRWVRLVTTEHQLAIGNRPSGAYVACATEAKSWEAANEAFSRRESRGKESRGGRKRSSIVFYESLDLEFLESKTSSTWTCIGTRTRARRRFRRAWRTWRRSRPPTRPPTGKRRRRRRGRPSASRAAPRVTRRRLLFRTDACSRRSVRKKETRKVRRTASRLNRAGTTTT